MERSVDMVVASTIVRDRHKANSILLEHYEDTGCNLAPKCIKCPLPECKYDDPAGVRRYLIQQRGLAITTYMQELDDELPAITKVQLTATKFQITNRTVWRMLRGRANGRSSRT